MKTTIKQLVKPVVVSLASRFGPHARPGKSPRLWLLMYHRILPERDVRYGQEEPGMLIRPETLEMHIKEIRKEFELVSLSEWIHAKQTGQVLPERACAITFDDGWLDNYEYAFPVLKANAAPATLFAVAEKIGTDFQFWPNIIATLILKGAASELAAHPRLQSHINVPLGLASMDQIAEVIRRLKAVSDAEIYAALDDISWRSLCDDLPPALMSWAQLREMHQSGLVDIGSHTCTHRRLTNALSVVDLEYEIVQSKSILEQRLQSPINLFCFPNGDYNEVALSLVKQHYQAAVTTKRGINDAEQIHMHELTRVGLHEEVSHRRDLLRARLSGWV